ncbi:MAG: hypothetical protein ACRDKB_09145 [Actinomycetota bacterium]
MNRLRIAAVVVTVVAIGFVPLQASADHVNFIPDAQDCLEMAAPGGTFTDPDQADRGAECVSDGNPANGVEYYLGGEAQTEAAYEDDPEHVPGDACGALVVAGQVLTATRPDNPDTAADERLDWDWLHLHDPDGVPDSGDEFQHHHTCD